MGEDVALGGAAQHGIELGIERRHQLACIRRALLERLGDGVFARDAMGEKIADVRMRRRQGGAMAREIDPVGTGEQAPEAGEIRRHIAPGRAHDAG
jgi:hypothetical protein